MPFKSKEQRREYNRLYQELNRDRLRPLEREKARRNKEQRYEYKKEWYSRPDVNQRQRSLVNEWISRNAEKHKAYASVCRKRRKARMRGADGFFTRQQWLWRLEYYGYCCGYCYCSLTEETAQIDHIIPLFSGGTNWPANLAPACRQCNNRKGIKRVFPGRKASGQSAPRLVTKES